jgi:hypothetical protein
MLHSFNFVPLVVSFFGLIYHKYPFLVAFIDLLDHFAGGRVFLFVEIYNARVTGIAVVL